MFVASLEYLPFLLFHYVQSNDNTDTVVVPMELSSYHLSKVSCSSIMNCEWEKTWMRGETTLRVVSQILQQRLVISEVGDTSHL